MRFGARVAIVDVARRRRAKRICAQLTSGDKAKIKSHCAETDSLGALVARAYLVKLATSCWPRMQALSRLRLDTALSASCDCDCWSGGGCYAIKLSWSVVCIRKHAPRSQRERAREKSAELSRVGLTSCVRRDVQTKRQMNCRRTDELSAKKVPLKQNELKTNETNERTHTHTHSELFVCLLAKTTAANVAIALRNYANNLSQQNCNCIRLNSASSADANSSSTTRLRLDTNFSSDKCGPSNVCAARSLVCLCGPTEKVDERQSLKRTTRFKLDNSNCKATRTTSDWRRAS